MSEHMDLSGRVAVVTGGGNGIGAAAAARFAALGATVVVGDVDTDAAQQVAGDIGGTGVHCDVTNDEHMTSLAETALALGPIGVVMANAGVAVGGRFDSVPIEEWTRILDVNVVGVVRTIKPFAAMLEDQGSGQIIITGSSAGLFSIEGGGNSPYATTKFALMGLARALGRQFEDSGVSVHYLAPRITDTAFPRSSIAWGRKGSRVTNDRPVEGADTVEQVIDALVAGMEIGEFVISLTDGTEERLADWAADLRP